MLRLDHDIKGTFSCLLAAGRATSFDLYILSANCFNHGECAVDALSQDYPKSEVDDR